MAGERCWDAEDDGVLFRKAGKIRCSGESLSARLLHFLRRDTKDVRAACLQVLNFSKIDIEAGHAEAGVSQKQGEWKTHVPEADDADAGSAGVKTLQAFGDCGRGVWRGNRGHVAVIIALRDGVSTSFRVAYTCPRDVDADLFGADCIARKWDLDANRKLLN